MGNAQAPRVVFDHGVVVAFLDRRLGLPQTELIFKFMYGIGPDRSVPEDPTTDVDTESESTLSDNERGVPEWILPPSDEW